jgi:hypothetical protein
MSYPVMERNSQSSEQRLQKLREDLAERLDGALPGPARDRIAIYATGSLARLEANSHSDLDAFFYVLGTKERDRLDTVEEVHVFHNVIESSKDNGFPDFSNGGEYLHFQYLDDVVENIGSRQDDYINGLTSRMLLILESCYVYNDSNYRTSKEKVIDRYFADFHDHRKEFRPIFILNDILRFWRTLCLNYEHGREWRNGDGLDRARGHLKNLKLRFSRLLICYSFVAGLLDRGPALTREDVLAVSDQTPLQRLQALRSSDAAYIAGIDELLAEYEWFLREMDRDKDEALIWISDEGTRLDAFARGENFSKTMASLVTAVAQKHGYARYLVI